MNTYDPGWFGGKQLPPVDHRPPDKIAIDPWAPAPVAVKPAVLPVVDKIAVVPGSK